MLNLAKTAPNLKITRFLQSIRTLSNLPENKTTVIRNEKGEELIRKVQKKIIFNTILENRNPTLGFIARKKLESKQREISEELLVRGQDNPIPICLKYILRQEDFKENLEDTSKIDSVSDREKPAPYFPLDSTNEIATSSVENRGETFITDKADAIDVEVRQRNTMGEELGNWMTSYDNFDDSLLEHGRNEWKANYGTPDPKSEISSVPCGGCGAPLHCKDTSIPGYIPSEIFKNSFRRGGSNLASIICQRCYFLKHHNLALQMRVSPDDYPKVLATVSQRRGLLVLMVDLLDFPCSIWPGVADIFGPNYPMVVVGNKVDLLPRDSEQFLDRVKKLLVECVRVDGFGGFNLKHVTLISAKTGYGIEELITKLNSFYEQIKGDIYLVGCTNVGKSSLFNALLQSDFCKIQAVDLIQRATTSVWPGTTLNLLKFPIKRPVGYRQYLRHHRLKEQYKVQKEEEQFRKEQLRQTSDPKYATLIGHIDITRNHQDPDEVGTKDLFSVGMGTRVSGSSKMGIDENKDDYAYGKWCYDTPGVVQPDQITNLLTTEELLLTLPKEIIIPRFFILFPGQTIFIAGLSRLDYVGGTREIKVALFASKELPVTICKTEEATGLYNELIESNLAVVPVNDKERLKKWPDLALAKEFVVTGQGRKVSRNDVVLSSSGWIALTGPVGEELRFEAWTPEGRGVHVRESILPFAVARCGPRIRGTPQYGAYRFFTK